jgi:hypothetical protein
VLPRQDVRLKCAIAAAAALLLLGCGGGGHVIQLPDPSHPDLEEAGAAIQRLNLYRGLAAVQPVDLDTYLSSGCQAHANYLAVNNVSLQSVALGAHHEDPSMPGYSYRGDQAGRSSVIYQGVTAVAAIDNWMRTFYHRLGLLDPNLHYVGFGSALDYQVMDILSGRVAGLIAAPGQVLYPAPGMTGVPRDYKREIPHPIPGDDTLGIPITVEFFGDRGIYISQVQTNLIDVTAGGATIPCYRQTPGHPYLPEWPRDQVIALIPEDPLPALHEIHVEVTAMVDGERWAADWQFTTQ